jgi:hypothetical protein
MAQPRTLTDELAALRDSVNATAAVIREAEPDHTDILLIGRSFRGIVAALRNVLAANNKPTDGSGHE